MKNIKNVGSSSQRCKALRFCQVILAVVATLVSGVGSAPATADVSATSKGNQPLVTSQLYIADASYCRESANWTGDNYYYSPAPCNLKYTKYFHGSTVWAISVTNPNKSAEARNVRARVVLLDAAGNEVMNKVMQVAARLAPGQTTWLAPAADGISWYYKTDPSEGQGVVASGTVTVLPHPWARGSKLRTISVPMTFAASASTSEYHRALFFYEPSATFPNPGASFEGYFTVILYGDNGVPIGGVRQYRGQLADVERGTNNFSFDFNIPGTLSSRIADIRLFVSR